MSFPDRSWKYAVLGILTAIFIGWLIWYVRSYLKIVDAEVRMVAEAGIHCPKEQIEIGPSYQSNDGPSEFPVSGCGQKGMVFCDNKESVHGLWAQYFTVDIECRFIK